MPDFDTSELTALANDLTTAAARTMAALVPVAAKAGVNIKRIMQDDATGHRGLPGLPRFVEYDLTTRATSVTVEVGFRQEGTGNLANIAAFGDGTHPPVMDITRGLKEEAPKFAAFAVRALGKL